MKASNLVGLFDTTSDRQLVPLIPSQMDTINDVVGTSWQLGPILLARWAFGPALAADAHTADAHTANAWQMLTKRAPAAGCQFLPPLDYPGASDTLAARVSFKELREASPMHLSLRSSRQTNTGVPASWTAVIEMTASASGLCSSMSLFSLMGICLLQAMPMA